MVIGCRVAAFTRNDGTENAGYSRLTDGDLDRFWKSNPYLTQEFHGREDALHPQWVDARSGAAAAGQQHSHRVGRALMRGATWCSIGRRRRSDQSADARECGRRFLRARLTKRKGRHGDGPADAAAPVAVRFVRVWMTESSNTCDARWSMRIREIAWVMRFAKFIWEQRRSDGAFHDIVRHTTDQEQTTTYCSSVDPWHRAADLDRRRQATMGFDLFYTSGVTRGLPAMIPVAMMYDTPENAAAEIAYSKKREYPISYVEMGEEADGQYMLPEDYAALYLQWATALHRRGSDAEVGRAVVSGSE